MSEPRYPLTYDLRSEDPPLTRAEIEHGRGACDAAVLLSLIYHDDGSSQMELATKDGRTGDELPDAEVFRCWATLAKHLAESRTLHPNKRELARTLWEVYRSAHASTPPRAGG